MIRIFNFLRGLKFAYEVMKAWQTKRRFLFVKELKETTEIFTVDVVRGNGLSDYDTYVIAKHLHDKYRDKVVEKQSVNN